MSRALPYILVFLALTLAGCSRTRTVTVQGEPPPPTVVTETRVDTVWATPDTVFLPAADVPVYVTVPEQVVVYREARQDTSRAFPVWHVGVTPASGLITLYGRYGDHAFRLPALGEDLRITARAPDRLDARIEGEPLAPEPVTVECPAPPDPLLANTLRGWVTLVGLLFMGAAAGAVAVAVLKP